jgi:fumarate reductase flavoprotein subunit
MELGPRDRLSQAFVKEVEKGRTFEGPYGPYVHLDIRHLGKRKIEKKLPLVRELCLQYVGIDPVAAPIPVRPAVHYVMGGVHTDVSAATPLPGLYAAGECACVSINGANRLGSNSLTELLVFGARAGANAAAFASAQGPPAVSALEAQAADERKRLAALFAGGGGERIATIRAELQRSMESGASIYRDATRLSATTAKIAELKERYKKVHLDDSSRTFNTEWVAAVELGTLLDCAEAAAHSALARTESRGSHQRTEHPERDDARFLAHSLAYRGDGAPRIERLPVTITRWPPGQRVYGRAEPKPGGA